MGLLTKIWPTNRILRGGVFAVAAIALIGFGVYMGQHLPFAQNNSATILTLNLAQAIREGRSFELRNAIQAGLNPNIPVDEKGTTLLILAAQNGRADVIEFLLANGANPNQADREGLIPLRAAAAAGHTDIVRILMTYK